MRTAVDHFTTAEKVALDQARGLARTIADTLTAMYPSAAYLVLERDEDDPDVLWLHSIRDITGGIVRLRTRLGRLPGLTDADLRQAWGELDPQLPGTCWTWSAAWETSEAASTSCRTRPSTTTTGATQG